MDHDDDRSSGYGSVDQSSLSGWSARKQTSSRSWAARTVVLSVVLFCLILWLFVFANEDFPNFAWVLVTLSALLAGLLIVTGIGVGRGEHVAMGMICLASVILATALGLVVEHQIMKEYWHLSNGSVFSSVSPMDAKAGTYQDATELHFTPDAFTDTRRTLGMKFGGAMYCVAPVAGSMQAPSVEFWAVGKNCCLGRIGFSCDDSADGMVKSAITVSKRIGDDYGLFKDAIEQAKHAYGTLSPDNAILLRWVADPDKAGGKLWTQAVWIVVVVCVLHCILSSMISCALLQDVTDRRLRRR